MKRWENFQNLRLTSDQSLYLIRNHHNHLYNLIFLIIYLPIKNYLLLKKKVLITDFTKILCDLYPKDYSQHIDNWPNTLWGKQVINTKDFQAIENFFVTEFVDVLHKRYPHDYPANFKDWNSKNSQWGKEVILTKNFKTIGKWLPTYKKEVLEEQKVLKNDF